MASSTGNDNSPSFTTSIKQAPVQERRLGEDVVKTDPTLFKRYIDEALRKRLHRVAFNYNWTRQL